MGPGRSTRSTARHSTPLRVLPLPALIGPYRIGTCGPADQTVDPGQRGRAHRQVGHGPPGHVEARKAALLGNADLMAGGGHSATVQFHRRPGSNSVTVNGSRTPARVHTVPRAPALGSWAPRAARPGAPTDPIAATPDVDQKSPHLLRRRGDEPVDNGDRWSQRDAHDRDATPAVTPRSRARTVRPGRHTLGSWKAQ